MTTTILKQLGDYNLIKHLGDGALGSTYLAQHRFLKRQFVLKVLSQELGNDEGFVSRFEQEAALLATLEHPNIVKVHTVSESDGIYYLVTDAIVDEKGDATNLYDYFRQKGGRLSEDEIVKIVTQIASALDYIHEKGHAAEPFAHRGLKPTNILINKKDFTIQISDFGLSKVMGPANYMSHLYRVLAEKMGQAPEMLPKRQLSFLHHYIFLAPEQKWEKNSSSGAKADAYAFGVLIYFLLTGQFPEGVFELPSQHAPHHKLAWDKIVRQCLNSDPQKRPSSLKELLEGLSGKVEEVEMTTTSLKPVLKPAEIQRPEYEPDPGAIFQKETVVDKYQPVIEDKKEVDPLLTEMVIIRGGSFERGSNKGGRDEIPRHQIILEAFAMDIHPVTNEQFVQFLDAMGGEKDHNNNDIIRLRESRIKRLSGKLSIESGYNKHPIVGVTWYGAVAYAKWIGKRLPTEAEWEIASAGGLIEANYPTGVDIDRSHANYFSSDTTPVMSYPCNGYGLYDMAGNVYEWCQDWYDYHYYNQSVQEPKNPKGPHQGVYRVLRGGCWKSLKEDLRCSHRHRNNPGTMNGTYGFRCAADVES